MSKKIKQPTRRSANIIRALKFSISQNFKYRPVFATLSIILEGVYAATASLYFFVYSQIFQNLSLVVTGEFEARRLWISVALWAGIWIARRVYSYVFAYAQVKSDAKFKLMLDLNSLAKFESVDYKYFRSTQFEDLVSLNSYNITEVSWLYKLVLSLFSSIFYSISVMAVLASFHYTMPIILIIVYIPMIFFNFWARKLSYQRSVNDLAVRRKKNTYERLLKNNSSIPEIRNYNADTYLLEKWKEYNAAVNESALKIKKKRNLILSLQTFVESVIFVSILIYSMFLTLDGMILAGQFIACVAAIRSFIGNLYTITSDTSQIIDLTKSSNDYIDYMNFKEQSNGTVDINTVNKIEFKNVNFAYLPKDENEVAPNIINNLNLTINKGQTIAIVGKNGSGKTTLTSILLGLYEPTGGDVFVNDINLKDINKNSYVKLITLTNQEFATYNSFSLSENVAISDIENKDNSEILKNAIEKAKIQDVANGNLDKLIGRRFDGLEFSKGQKQKLAIARGFFKSDAEIFVFDEPSSALDAVVEDEILNNFLETVKNKTAIVISHRLSVCKDVDKVVFMEDGQVVEYGSHDELMLLNGKYAEMFLNQQKWYK